MINWLIIWYIRELKLFMLHDFFDNFWTPYPTGYGYE